MLQLLVDTRVWLDAAKDYRHRRTLQAVEHMIEVGEVSLVVPRQTVDEFAQQGADRQR
jgi:hypothetical protein